MARPGRAIGFVFVTALLDSVGFGIIVPVLPKLIMEVTGDGLSTAARDGGMLMMVYALMQFFCAPIMGNLSDRFGRRPVLLTSMLVLAGDYVIMSWAPTLAWLFVGRTIAGCAASTFSICNAFVADVTKQEERAQYFGLLGAAFGAGFVVGPVIGGFLGSFGPRVPFLGAALLTALNFGYGALVLPETLPKESRRRFEWRRANPTGTLMALRKYPIVLGLAGAHFLFMMGHHVLPSTWAYFTMEKFQWSEREVGYSLGFVGLLMVIVQAGLLRWVLARLSPRNTGLLGYGFAITSFVGFAFAQRELVLYLFLIPGALSGFVSPAGRGIMSAHAPKDAQGELQGGLGSVSSLTSILSPPLMTQVFGEFTGPQASPYFPGAPFIVAALLTLLSLAVFARSTATYRRHSPPIPTMGPE